MSGAVATTTEEKGFFGKIGHFFTDGWNKLSQGNIKDMSWGQLAVAGIAGAIAIYAAFSLLKTIWEMASEYLPWILGAVVVTIGALALFGMLGRNKDAGAVAPDPAADKVDLTDIRPGVSLKDVVPASLVSKVQASCRTDYLEGDPADLKFRVDGASIEGACKSALGH